MRAVPSQMSSIPPSAHPPAASGPQGPHLAIVRGPRRGTILPLVFSETLLGRIDSNHIVVEDDSVSRVHARLRRRPEGVFVEDLASKAGTFVNGRRIEGSTRLQDGDQLVVGTVAFVFAHPQGE